MLSLPVFFFTRLEKPNSEFRLLFLQAVSDPHAPAFGSILLFTWIQFVDQLYVSVAAWVPGEAPEWIFQMQTQLRNYIFQLKVIFVCLSLQQFALVLPAAGNLGCNVSNHDIGSTLLLATFTRLACTFLVRLFINHLFSPHFCKVSPVEFGLFAAILNHLLGRSWICYKNTSSLSKVPFLYNENSQNKTKKAVTHSFSSFLLLLQGMNGRSDKLSTSCPSHWSTLIHLMFGNVCVCLTLFFLFSKGNEMGANQYSSHTNLKTQLVHRTVISANHDSLLD